MSIHSEAQLDQRFIVFARLLNTYLQHFPKHEKYGLALHIRQCAYDVYGLIVEGQKRYFKKTSLTQLDIRHEQLRMMVRLAHELGYFGFRDGAGKETGATRAEHRRRFQHLDSGISPFSTVCPRQSLVVDPRQDGPVFGGQSEIANIQGNIAPGITQLHGRQHPSAVIRGVIASIVDPVKGMLRCGWGAHVGQECVKRRPPFCAYFDTSAAVIVVTGVFRVFASLNYAAPAMVKRIIASRLRCFALGGRGRARLFAQAPA